MDKNHFMKPVGERLATLEEHKAHTNEALDVIADTLDSINKHMATVDTKVGQINLKVEKSLSFVGGIAFTFSAMGAAFMALVMYILNRMGIHV